MYTSFKALMAASVFTAVTALAAGAQASTVIGTLNSTNPAGGTVIRNIVTGAGAPQFGAVQNAERFDLSRSGGSSLDVLIGTGAANEFLAFCVEPREFIYYGVPVTYDLVPLDQAGTNLGGIGAAKAGQIEELFGRFSPNLAGPMTTLQAGAFQIAVWEIVREFSSNPLDVTSGNIYFDAGSDNPSGMISQAQTYLNALDGTGPKARGLRALNVVGGQDLLVQVTVPEPGAWALMICGFGLAGAALRRRRAVAA